jgi:hypothetical protein
MIDRWSHPTQTSRRGAALLIVLATLAVAATACATLARVASTRAARHRFHARSAAAADVLRAADAPIHRWLETKSGSVVLPPEAPIAEVVVLHDVWPSGADRIDLCITAYDQCGMLPIETADPLLRAAAPPEVASLVSIPDRRNTRAAPPGLDLFAADADRAGLALFPSPMAPAPTLFGDAVQDGSEPPRHNAAAAPALGAWVATHNPGRFINVNTAPIPLIKAALQSAGRGGLDQILKARSDGKRAAAPPPAPRRIRGQTAPVPVSASTAWAIRVDARVGPVVASSWRVYVNEAGRWRCAQKLVIDR